MTERNDGGPAFPRTGNFDCEAESQFDSTSLDGMTLRQYYAAKAMAAMIAYGGGRIDEDWVSKRALDFADAMLDSEEK